VFKAVLFVSLYGIVFCPASSSAQDLIAQADALYTRGGLQNYQKAIELYLQFLADNPNDFDGNWKCARTHREYGENTKRQMHKDWRAICAQHGKTGMQYGQKAIELEPDRVEGHYYFGLNVGLYTDGKSVLAALREGLKNKSQHSFERAYALNKMYADAGPIVSLGRFWAVLPWPMKDKKKALKYYREYQVTPYFEGNAEAQIYLSELLLKLGGKQNEAEARGLLEGAGQTEKPYYRDWAHRLLAQLPQQPKINDN